MHRVAISAVVITLAASRGHAQRGREISLPDTLGANFSIADTATKAGTPADYDTFDGGKTWLLDAWTMEATRIGR